MGHNHGRWKCLKVGGASSGLGHGERVEREPVTGVWGRSQPPLPWQRILGQKFTITRSV